MNLRNVLRAYSLLRQLSDDEAALLNILRALNDNDREQLVASMSDKPQKKAGKKAAGGGGKSSKSARASGMAKTLNDNLSQRRQETIDDVVERDTGEPARCHFTRANGNPCKLLPDHNIHHMTTANEYHEFQSASTTTGKSDAQGAAGGL